MRQASIHVSWLVTLLFWSQALDFIESFLGSALRRLHLFSLRHFRKILFGFLDDVYGFLLVLHLALMTACLCLVEDSLGFGLGERCPIQLLSSC